MKYDKYKFNMREWAKCSMMYVCISGIISYLFYDSLWAFLIILLFFPLFVKRNKEICTGKRVEDLKIQFIQMISYMTTSLEAGLSIENSVKESGKDIVKMYGEDSIMAKEINNIVVQLDAGQRLEDIMMDFSERSGVSEIKDFATVFSIAKKSGGKFSEIISRSINVMVSNRETEKQIQILISGKRYEQRILSLVPFLVITVLRLTSKDFISTLYHNPLGIIIMSVCLIMYLFSIWLSEKISDIKC